MFKYKFDSENLKGLYLKYKEIRPGNLTSFNPLIDEMHRDDVLKSFAAESCLETIVDTEDFYQYLTGTKVVFTDGRFEIYESLDFIDSIPAYKHNLNDANVKRVFPDNFTPEMFRNGILDYIVSLDKVFNKSIDSKKFERKGPFNGFKYLANLVKRKKA
mgnify:FL=1